MSPEYGWFVKGIYGNNQEAERVKDAISLLSGIETITETYIPIASSDRREFRELDTMGKILQACHNLPPTQLRWLLGHLHLAVAQTPSLLELQGDREFLSAAEVGVMWGVSAHRVRVLIHKGRLPATQDDLGHYRIATADLKTDPRKPSGHPSRK